MRVAKILCALILFVIPPTVSAQDIFTPQHVAKMRIVTEAVISPDGSQVAYVLSVPRDLPKEKDGPSWAELHVVDKNGTSTPFITGPVNVAALAWTPDGKSIAFLTKREKDETRSLYLIGTRGGEARKVLTHSTDIQSYSLSGDGKQVAFLATEPVAKAQKTQQDQGFNQEIYEEDQPPTRVWIADLASQERKRLEDGVTPAANAPNSLKMLKLEGSASEVAWNPKEDKLAVALAPNALIDEHLMFRKLHIVDLKTEKAISLNNPGKMGQFAWSPDGKKLALITGADKHDPKEGRLWLHNIGTNGWTDLLPQNPDGHLESIAWQDDSNVALIFSHGASTTIFAASVQGNKVRQALVPDDRIESYLSISRDGKSNAYIVHTPKHPPEVYFSGYDGDGPRRLTDSNPWLRTMKLAGQEVIKYKARDGLELEGILVKPLSGKAGQRYPLVLTVHGGPEAHYSNGWVTLYHSLGQVAAGKEFDDLVDGVDHLVKIGLVDKQKVGITGGSYGGYATAWGSTYYSDRFAAGVMFVGVSDWISCSGTTDIPHEMHLVHHRKWLWEDWDYFLKSSPVFHVDKAKTPLLILHGKNDPRVHPSQSLELYRHLKVRGQAPVRLVLYPGEGHGNRRTASRLDYNLRLLQWMEHYLKGPGGAMPALEIDYGLTAPTKTSSAGWDRPERIMATTQWGGRGCPCCIGW
jgi:dipeptidyl aminopeptidase/acylaminoacyl peptidase